MTTFLDVATTFDTYAWPLGGDFRWRWALQTTDDPSATTGAPEDVSDVTAVRMWLKQKVDRGQPAATPIAFVSTDDAEVSLDTSDPDQAWLVVGLTDQDDGAAAVEGTYDVLIAFDRAGGVKDDVAAFTIKRALGPRPGP